MSRFETGDIIEIGISGVQFVICRATRSCGVLPRYSKDDIGYFYDSEDDLIYGAIYQSDELLKVGKIDDLSVEDLLRWDHLHTYLSHVNGNRKSKYEI